MFPSPSSVELHQLHPKVGGSQATQATFMMVASAYRAILADHYGQSNVYSSDEDEDLNDDFDYEDDYYDDDVDDPYAEDECGQCVFCMQKNQELNERLLDYMEVNFDDLSILDMFKHYTSREGRSEVTEDPDICDCEACRALAEREAAAKKAEDEREAKMLDPPPKMEAPVVVPSKSSQSTIYVKWEVPTWKTSSQRSAVENITEYTLFIRFSRSFGGYDEWQLVYRGLDTNYTVPRLLPGTKYQFKIRAVNKKGPSLVWSDYATHKTEGPTSKAKTHPPIVDNVKLSRATGAKNGNASRAGQEARQRASHAHHHHHAHGHSHGHNHSSRPQARSNGSSAQKGFPRDRRMDGRGMIYNEDGYSGPKIEVIDDDDVSASDEEGVATGGKKSSDSNNNSTASTNSTSNSNGGKKKKKKSKKKKKRKSKTHSNDEGSDDEENANSNNPSAPSMSAEEQAQAKAEKKRLAEEEAKAAQAQEEKEKAEQARLEKERKKTEKLEKKRLAEKKKKEKAREQKKKQEEAEAEKRRVEEENKKKRMEELIAYEKYVLERRTQLERERQEEEKKQLELFEKLKKENQERAEREKREEEEAKKQKKKDEEAAKLKLKQQAKAAKAEAKAVAKHKKKVPANQKGASSGSTSSKTSPSFSSSNHSVPQQSQVVDTHVPSVSAAPAASHPLVDPSMGASRGQQQQDHHQVNRNQQAAYDDNNGQIGMGFPQGGTPYNNYSSPWTSSASSMPSLSSSASPFSPLSSMGGGGNASIPQNLNAMAAPFHSVSSSDGSSHMHMPPASSQPPGFDQVPTAGESSFSSAGLDLPLDTGFSSFSLFNGGGGGVGSTPATDSAFAPPQSSSSLAPLLMGDSSQTPSTNVSSGWGMPHEQSYLDMQNTPMFGSTSHWGTPSPWQSGSGGVDSPKAMGVGGLTDNSSATSNHPKPPAHPIGGHGISPSSNLSSGAAPGVPVFAPPGGNQWSSTFGNPSPWGGHPSSTDTMGPVPGIDSQGTPPQPSGLWDMPSSGSQGPASNSWGYASDVGVHGVGALNAASDSELLPGAVDVVSSVLRGGGFDSSNDNVLGVSGLNQSSDPLLLPVRGGGRADGGLGDSVLPLGSHVSPSIQHHPQPHHHNGPASTPTNNIRPAAGNPTSYASSASSVEAPPSYTLDSPNSRDATPTHKAAVASESPSLQSQMAKVSLDSPPTQVESNVAPKKSQVAAQKAKPSPSSAKSSPSKKPRGEPHIIHLRGLPWDTSESDIREWLGDCDFSDEGVFVCRFASGKLTGEAFAVVYGQQSMEQAVSMHEQYLGHRYIEVRKSTDKEYKRAKALYSFDSPDGDTNSRGSRLCRYGATCKRHKRGECRFVHPSATPSNECEYSNGMIFLCSAETEKEVMEKGVFGLPKAYLEQVETLKEGSSALFLYNTSSRLLHGVFEAASGGALNIEPRAFCRNANRTSPYPAQVRFRDSSYGSSFKLKKAECVQLGFFNPKVMVRMLDAQEVQLVVDTMLSSE